MPLAPESFTGWGVRTIASGDYDKLHQTPGFKDPVHVIMPHANDKKYRRYNEIKIPNSNAVVMFARDCSGSMDDEKCSIVSDMSWWLDVWIRRFYEKVERCFFVHDAEAEEVDGEKFYSYRSNGGVKRGPFAHSGCPPFRPARFPRRHVR